MASRRKEMVNIRFFAYRKYRKFQLDNCISLLSALSAKVEKTGVCMMAFANSGDESLSRLKASSGVVNTISDESSCAPRG